MKKLFKSYALIWVVLLAAFNVVCFVLPNAVSVGGHEYAKFGGVFWVGYIFITIAFIGQLACAYRAFNTDDKTRFFYNIPVIRVSYTGLILTIIFGAACMVIPDLPNWVGVILCFVILAFTAIAVIKADTTAEVIEDIDKKISAKTAFIKELTADTESLVSHAATADAKAACTKVYEALRYSDPMSNDTLADIESELSKSFAVLSNAVKANDANAISNAADAFLIVLGDRNRKCKLLK